MSIEIGQANFQVKVIAMSTPGGPTIPIDFFSSLQEHAAGVAEAMRELGMQFRRMGRSLPQSELSRIKWFGVKSYEDALRQYAALYNMSHPHKKISWRRLNHLQRKRALELFG